MNTFSSERQLAIEVNGRQTTVRAQDGALLLDVVRDRLGLTGTKRSCDIEVCGACTVLLNGLPVSACTTLAYEADGSALQTIEGLSNSDGTLHPLQQAFVDHGALQCGFCTPGMIMTIVALLEDNPQPTREEVAEMLEGNICRCTGYVKIIDAVLAYASTAAADVPGSEGKKDPS